MSRLDNRTALAFLLAALSPFGSTLLAQEKAATKLETGRVLARTYEFEEAEREVGYALYVPKSYDAKKPAPLIVLLHGLGSNPRQVMSYQGITAQAEERGYVVVAPYGYNERGWYGSRGKGKDGPFFGRRGDPDNLGELSEKDVFNVLGIVREELSIDPERIFLMGHSMGGAGTIYLGATRRNLWAGLAPLAPAVGGSMDLLEGLGKTPVFVVTGDRDRLVQVTGVRRWVKEMKRLEVPCRYEEIEGGDHVRAIARNPEMIAKVFAFFDGLRKGQEESSDFAEPGDGKADRAKGPEKVVEKKGDNKRGR